MSNVTRIIMFRHGETDWNKQRKWQGHSDIPLNANGEMQASKLAVHLETEDLAHIFTSDLSRAAKTAEAVASRAGCKITHDRRLREIFLGDAEGKHLHETDDLFGTGTLERFFANDNGDFNFPNGETKIAHLERLLECIYEVAPRYAGKTIAFSSHGGSLHRIFSTAWHDLNHRIQLPNCARMYLTVDADLKLNFAYKTKPPFSALD